MRIGIDIMGGDFAPETTLSGAILARKQLPSDIQIVLIGNGEAINSSLEKEKAKLDRFEIVNSTEVVEMGESPTKTFSQKPDSSIAVGFRLLKKGEIDGFASSGNSGAMLVGAFHSVGAVPGVIRPCITTDLPKENGSFNILLDVGINADCKPDVLYQFAILGSQYAANVYNIKNPKVGLLNIGEEEDKGNLLSQATYRLMKDTKDFNFIGNVEGGDIFDDKVDIIVCDGFTGNVIIKEAEAFYTLIKKRGLSDEYFDRFNYENYGGTPILGVNSTVIIGHGRSTDIAIKNMILLTKEVVEAKLSDKIKEAFK